MAMKLSIKHNGITRTDGYADLVRCGLGHSGNHRLAQATRDYWQCQGCGALFSAADVARGQRGEGLHREIGAGGLIAKH